MPSDSSAPASAARTSIDLRHLSSVSKLAADYAHNFPGLSPYFAGNPEDPEAWAQIIRQTHARPRRDVAPQVATVIDRQQQLRGAPPQAIAAAARLSDPRTVAIVTGQQAGLFGGPLYTLLKALTAIQLTARVSREHGVNAVTVFWVDAEDHDWDEVASCQVLDAELQLHTIRLPPPAGAGEGPVAAVHLDAGIEPAIAELFSTLPPTEFSDDLSNRLRAAYEPGRGMADSFSRWLESVLGPYGLVVFDASDPAAKPLAASVFIRELEAPGQTSNLAAATGAELTTHGYHAQVTPAESSVALFYLNSGRRPIRRQDAGFLLGADATPQTPASVLAEARANPAMFSPNVLLRPLVQDTLFPTICYVAGPSELAYLGQLRRVYSHFGLVMPLVVPRVSVTLLDSASTRFLTRYQLPLEALEAQDDRTLNGLLAAQLPESVDRAVQAAIHGVDERLAAVIAAVPEIDPTLEGAARSTLGRMQHDLKTLQSKIIQAAKRRDETLRRQFQHARALAFPGGHPQQRTIAFTYFLNRVGPALVDRLLEDLPLDFGHHWILTL